MMSTCLGIWRFWARCDCLPGMGRNALGVDGVTEQVLEPGAFPDQLLANQYLAGGHTSAKELTGLALRRRRRCAFRFDWVLPLFFAASAARLSLSKRVSRVATASAGSESYSASLPSTINAERPWTRDQHARETSPPSESPSKNFAASTACRRALKQALPASSKTGCQDFFSIVGPNIS